MKKEIKIRNSGFENLFKHILSVSFAEDWEMIPTDDNSINPLVIFKTNKWEKLHLLVKSFVNNNKKDWSENTTDFDLEVGSLVGIQYKIEDIGRS